MTTIAALTHMLPAKSVVRIPCFAHSRIRRGGNCGGGIFSGLARTKFLVAAWTLWTRFFLNPCALRRIPGRFFRIRSRIIQDAGIRRRTA